MNQPIPATDRLGRYVDLVLLGQGGMGAVYKGRDPDLDRPVAIKVVLDNNPDFVERFRREAKAVARLQHPNIVQVYDFGQDEAGHPYFVMELVAGRPLDKIIEERGVLTAEEVASVLGQAAAGLQAAHEAGIIHRDIKPSNLLLDERGRIKLVDFGIARVGGEAMLTNPSSLLGTPTYISPEQVAGRPVDGRSDLYSLGVTCFHLLTGAPPFEATEPIALAIKHLNEEIPSLIERAPQTPPALAALIVRMCAKDPATRPQSAGDVAKRISEIQAELGGVSRPLAAVAAASAMASGSASTIPPTRAGTLPTDVDPPRKSPIVPIAIAGAFAVLAAGATVGVITLTRKPKPPVVADNRDVTPPKPGDTTAPPKPADTTAPPHTGEQKIVENAAHPPATGPVRMAVLKFKNLTGNHDLDGLEEGIGETIATDLATAHRDQVSFVERNQVGSETGEIDFNQTKYVDPSTKAQLGKIVGAEVAVQGAFQKSGRAVRISARFVNVETGEILDTAVITSKKTDGFAIQDEVAAQLKDRLLAVAKRVRGG